MPMTTSRQLKQPQLTLILQYNLLQDGNKETPPSIHQVRKNPEMFNFYEVEMI
jgi:hypothetical protein